MLRFISIFAVVFFSLAANAAKLQLLEKPTGVKVGAVYKSWEKIYTPDLCSPDAIVFKAEIDETSDFQSVVLTAAKGSSEDVETIISFNLLQSEDDVKQAVESAFNQMGMLNDESLAAQLLRVYQKRDARKVFAVSTEDASGDFVGYVIAIADLENKELVLLTYGDAFGSSSCEE